MSKIIQKISFTAKSLSYLLKIRSVYQALWFGINQLETNMRHCTLFFHQSSMLLTFLGNVWEPEYHRKLLQEETKIPDIELFWLLPFFSRKYPKEWPLFIVSEQASFNVRGWERLAWQNRGSRSGDGMSEVCMRSIQIFILLTFEALYC